MYEDVRSWMECLELFIRPFRIEVVIIGSTIIDKVLTVVSVGHKHNPVSSVYNIIRNLLNKSIYL